MKTCYINISDEKDDKECHVDCDKNNMAGITKLRTFLQLEQLAQSA